MGVWSPMGDLISGAVPKASSQEEEEENPSLASWECFPCGIQTYPREDQTDSGSQDGLGVSC